LLPVRQKIPVLFDFRIPAQKHSRVDMIFPPPTSSHQSFKEPFKESQHSAAVLFGKRRTQQNAATPSEKIRHSQRKESQHSAALVLDPFLSWLPGWETERIYDCRLFGKRSKRAYTVCSSPRSFFTKV
jgi:hypothetical protein